MKMKNSKYIWGLLMATLFMMACDHSENEALPDFLNGTQYGVLLHVDVSSGTTIPLGDLDATTVAFEVSYEGDQRPVEAVNVHKTFIPADGAASASVEQMSLMQFPASVSLSADDLVSNVDGLSKEALQVGDKFAIKFSIRYQDGFVATRFGTRLNPNFEVTIE